MSVSGPITAGARGGPWSAPLADLDARGYVMEEFFLDGMATSYRLRDNAEQTVDGHWNAEEDDRAPFRTRLLVVRPSEPSAFNGTVVVLAHTGVKRFSAEAMARAGNSTSTPVRDLARLAMNADLSHYARDHHIAVIAAAHVSRHAGGAASA